MVIDNIADAPVASTGEDGIGSCASAHLSSSPDPMVASTHEDGIGSCAAARLFSSPDLMMASTREDGILSSSPDNIAVNTGKGGSEAPRSFTSTFDGGEEEASRRYELIGRHDYLPHYFPVTLTMFINMQLIRKIKDGVIGAIGGGGDG